MEIIDSIFTEVPDESLPTPSKYKMHPQDRGQIFTNVSQEPAALIFRVEELP
jgi:hypothetical protein